ncbi:DUF4230 domain-containing protein [Pseudanabaena sp. FACHB-2040]|uniref:DUF4230 domain-containing protein n=1 Tax=Pseudanabaena sp. FACHB-2040 TaxID=2692859 RepID=UPI0016899B53|nr:DUF4230 domain-containing protein [Pseudanabaena sp. FACHB-2040]MBD2257886.1 DUF4230 domain-containing protein [Pseudanabaena sp. FACHB-2040]
MRTAPPCKKRPQRPPNDEHNLDLEDDYEPRHRRPQPFSVVHSLSNMVVGGAVILGLLAGVGIWRSGDRFFEGLRLMMGPTEPPAPRVDVRSVVVQQIRGASELTTAIFAMEAVVPTASDRTLAGYVIGSTKLLYVAYGEVRAGVDLSEITAENVVVDESTSSIRITLPPARILDTKLDLSRSNVFDYDRGFLGLGPDSAPQLQELAQQEALGKIVEAACTEDILQEATTRAELTVRQLLSTAGFNAVEVVSPPTADALCANSAIGDTVN